MSDEKEYELVENDLFLPGSRIKLDHTMFLNEYDITTPTKSKRAT